MTDGDNGLYIGKESSVDIALKLKQVLIDEELRKKMGRESRLRAEKMSWGNVAREYAEIYKEVSFYLPSADAPLKKRNDR